jgi:hypothetical protein
MRFRTLSIAGVFLLAIGTFQFNAGVSKAHVSTIQSDETPKIFEVRAKGRKLILTGENFADGAVILVDGEPQKTRNDENFPSTTLIAKKAADRIPDNTFVTIQVQNANSFTHRFGFFKGQIITLDFASKPLTMRVGDKFLLFLHSGDYQFTPSVVDEAIVKKVTDVEISGSQGVYEALHKGTTKLSAIGMLPCHSDVVRCLAPTLYVEFNIVVE